MTSPEVDQPSMTHNSPAKITAATFRVVLHYGSTGVQANALGCVCVGGGGGELVEIRSLWTHHYILFIKFSHLNTYLCKNEKYPGGFGKHILCRFQWFKQNPVS